MPIYEYECTKCGSEMEIVHGISEKARRKCPSCGGRLKRLISLNSFHLKGTGWYKTDYAKSGEKPKAAEAKTSESKEPKKTKESKETKKSGEKESTTAAQSS